MSKMKSFNLAKRISFAMLLVLILFVSISSIQAGDVNETILNSNEDIALSIENNDQLEIDGKSEINENVLEQNIKNQTQLTSPTTKVYYNGNYEVTLIDSNTGKSLANKEIKLSIDNVGYSANTNSKGIASINLKLNPGSYLATAYFAGDDNFNASNNLSGHVKILTTIKAKDITKYYKGSKNYQATYLDSNGKALKNKNVAIIVGGTKYTRKTNSNGVATLPINLKPGSYKVATSNPSTGEKLITTFKILSTISASNLKKVNGDSKKFVAKFFKNNGKPLAMQDVKIKIKDKTYTYKTNLYGQLIISFNAFKQGTYKVICYNNDGLSKTNTVKIFKSASTKITVGSYTFLTKDTKIIKGKFSTALGDDSKSGKVIKIYVNDKTYSKKTNSNGEFSLKLPSMAPGLHAILCDYVGNKFFKHSFVFADITILDNSNAKFTVNGRTSFGDHAGTPFGVVLTVGNVPLIKKKVVFDINGKTYTNVTNYSGFVSMPIDLAVGKYVVNYKFSGDSKVNGASGSCNITVVERTATKITCSYKTTYKDSLQRFDVYLKDSNGNPIPRQSVTLVIGNQNSTGKTDSEGHAVIKSVAPIGKYRFSILYKGNNKYKPSSKTGSTTVILSKYANGINEKKGSASNAYLKATKNCQVNNAKIKALVKSLTKGLTNDIDKAKALFEYVQLHIEYDLYYDTHNGAVGTLTSKKGNGVDQAHLLIAMYRAAGFKARYVHGNCNFYLSNEFRGHVWTQVLIDNTWICGDSSDLANNFGSISAWNVDKYTLLNKYLELPF